MTFSRSDRLTLTLRTSSAIPLELDGLTPDRVAKLSPVEVAKLPVYHGNRRGELGEHFDVAGDPSAGRIHIEGNTKHVKSIGAGMTAGSMVVENDAGLHAGAGMTGGSLTIGGLAGDWAGAEMRGGRIEVGGAGDQLGAAYRGSRRGMTGGVILCRGPAGDEVGLLMRGGMIVVEKDCGEFAGASMIAGTVFVFGRAGNRLGAGMKRGTILAGQIGELAPSFRYSCDYEPSFLPLYLKGVKALAADQPLPSFGRRVRCFRGDLITGGRGELLLASGE